MNIYQFIIKDHRAVANLFKKFKNSKSLTAKKNLAIKIAEELIIHLEAEHSTFYESLRSSIITRKLASHGTKEHKEIEKKISAVLNDRNYDKAWEDKVAELQKVVDHHVREEEWIIHPAAKLVLDSTEAKELKIVMEKQKKSIKKQLKA